MSKKTCILIALLIVVYTALTYSTCVSTKRHTEPLVEEPKVVVYNVAQEPKVIVIPDIPEEIANKEAQMPEWGFDFEYICRVVAAESRGEPYDGQVAVARCIWNSAAIKGMTMEEIVELPNRYTDPVPSNLVTESVRDACMYAFLGMDLPTEEPIEYFYSTANGGYSEWHENNLVHVITIGNHKFFKEREVN